MLFDFETLNNHPVYCSHRALHEGKHEKTQVWSIPMITSRFQLEPSKPHTKQFKSTEIHIT